MSLAEKLWKVRLGGRRVGDQTVEMTWDEFQHAVNEVLEAAALECKKEEHRAEVNHYTPSWGDASFHCAELICAMKDGGQ